MKYLHTYLILMTILLVKSRTCNRLFFYVMSRKNLNYLEPVGVWHPPMLVRWKQEKYD